MYKFVQCPKCQNTIPEERLLGSTVVCSCGWTSAASTSKSDRKTQMKTALTFTFTSSLFLLAIIQFINWDRHFLSVIPLKAKELTRTASYEDYRSLAAICAERLKHDCTERSLFLAFKQNQSSIETLEELGTLQVQRSKWAEAVETYTAYFQIGGDNYVAAYNFARSLGATGKIDTAVRYYEKALAAKPDVFQVTIAQSYIEFLIQNERFEQAHDAISNIRKLGENTAQFMDKEYKEIQERLGLRKKVASM